MEQNTVNNCVTGVWVDHGITLALNSNLLFLDDNTISADANGYCNNGIFVSDWASTVVPGSWEIKTNTITEAANGIFLQNVKKPTGAPVYDISDNVCQVRYAASGNINGIKALGCQGLNLTLNHIKYTPGSTAYLSGGNINAYGIYLQNSTNMTVSCNEIDDAARSMVFSGNCVSSTLGGYGITQNTMRQAQDGFVLLGGTAVIGQQGDLSVASNNYWDMSTFPNFITQTWNESSTQTVFYVNPITSGAQATQAISNWGIAAYNTIINTTNAPVSSQCGQVRALSAGSGNNAVTALNDTLYTNLLKSLVGDSTLLPVYNDESHWQRRKFAFDEIKNNVPLTSDTVLNSFYLNNQNTNFGKFASVEDNIIAGQYVQADNINNGAINSTITESNQQAVNQLMLQKLMDSAFVYSTSDIATIASIANQCPLQGGNAVYQARNLLMTIANDVIEFIDSCDYGVKRSMRSIQAKITSSENKLFKLYPNPNNGSMVLDYSLNVNDKAVITIFDMTGKEIRHYSLNTSTTQLKIYEDILNNGIYFYQIKVNKTLVQQDKLVIVK